MQVIICIMRCFLVLDITYIIIKNIYLLKYDVPMPLRFDSYIISPMF